MLIVPQNITAPQTITLVYKTPSLGANLSTVTSATLAVLRNDGTTATWTLGIVSATPSELVAQYTFTGAGEITGTGVYYLTAHLALPGGSVQANAIAMYVTGPNTAPARTEESAWLAATVTVAGAAVVQTWAVKASDVTLTPFTPWVVADTRAGTVMLTLWSAQDGDTVVFSDAFGSWANHNLTVIAASAQKVPTGAGAYGTSVTLSSAGDTARWKYSALLGQWISW